MGVFDGLVFCVSGTFSVSQGAIKERIEEHGGLISATVTKKCQVLIADVLGSTKCDKAIANGTAVVTEGWMEDSIQQGKLSTLAAGILSPSGLIKTGTAAAAPPKEKKPLLRRASAAATAPADSSSDSEEEEEEQKAPAKCVAVSAASVVVPASAPAKLTTVTLKGSSKAPVDPRSGKVATHHVLEQGGVVYDAGLNQTNIGANNNKSFCLQVLASDSGKEFGLFCKWGRVGAAGQVSWDSAGDSASSAIRMFERKFKDKTGNDWDSRANFTLKPGKYAYIERDYSPEDDDTKPAAAASSSGSSSSSAGGEVKSKLNPRVQNLIKLICDLRMMKESMVEIGYDANKLPLGKLSKEHLSKGFAILQQISDEMDGAHAQARLLQLSNEFYSLIPFVTQGMRPPEVISTPQLLKARVSMIESLGEVAMATRLLKDNGMLDENGNEMNRVDASYAKLHCNMVPLDPKGEEMAMIRTYTANTHGATHNKYDLEVVDAFAVEREGEVKRFGRFANDHNRQLLWHGSRLSNAVGIVSNGLRIAPKEAPTTGYMFGKGVYFASASSKSAGYVHATKENPFACMYLCEVALGNTNQLVNADYHAGDRLSAGQLSTHGVGRMTPDPSGFMRMKDGVVVPCGKLVQRPEAPRLALQYDEFITYSTEQIRIRYIVLMRLKYRH